MHRAAVFQSSPVEQMMGGRTTRWWTSASPQQNSPLCSSPPNLSSSSPSSLSGLPQYYPFPSGTGTLPSIPWHDNTQDLPESWSQLLLGGLEEDGRSSLVTPFQTKKEENNWEDQVLFQSPANAQMVDVIKEEERSAESTTGSYAYGINGNHEEVQPHASACRSDPWYQILPVSSPRSCITSFSSNNMLGFSNNKADGRHPKPAGCSSECNGTASGSALKKARIQASTAQSSFKVRKEKLGDRITALHQLVSPFGKTDTASVLLEAIGYIRFLQSQIEALSSPYLDTITSGSNTRNSQLLNEACLKKRRGTCDYKEGETDEQKDLKSRGLCLVPISCTTDAGNENGADYWASAFGATFR